MLCNITIQGTEHLAQILRIDQGKAQVVLTIPVTDIVSTENLGLEHMSGYSDGKSLVVADLGRIPKGASVEIYWRKEK